MEQALAIARLMLKQRQDAAVKRNPAAKSAVAEAYSAAQSSTLAVTNAVSALKKSRPQHAREGQGESHLPASALKSLVRDYEAFISEIERRLR